MPFPNILAGQRITADMLGLLAPTYYIKTADLGRSGVATSSDDNELAGMALDAGKYLVRTVLLTKWSTSGASTVDFKDRWAFTGTWSGTRACIGTAAGAANTTSASVRNIGSAFTTDQTYGVTGTFAHPIREDAVVTVTTAGDMSIQWAPANVAASTVYLMAGSYVEIRQIE